MDSKYEIIIFWSEEDEAFVAEVPELPGCMADGKTYQEALENAEQIIGEWIETAQEEGRPIPQPKGHPQRIYIPAILCYKSSSLS
jgi:predicted RNase H-like HicB family nuclease